MESAGSPPPRRARPTPALCWPHSCVGSTRAPAMHISHCASKTSIRRAVHPKAPPTCGRRSRGSVSTGTPNPFRARTRERTLRRSTVSPSRTGCIPADVVAAKLSAAEYARLTVAGDTRELVGSERYPTAVGARAEKRCVCDSTLAVLHRSMKAGSTSPRIPCRTSETRSSVAATEPSPITLPP